MSGKLKPQKYINHHINITSSDIRGISCPGIKAGLEYKGRIEAENWQISGHQSKCGKIDWM